METVNYGRNMFYDTGSRLLHLASLSQMLDLPEKMQAQSSNLF
jgi:hypothetical protein